MWKTYKLTSEYEVRSCVSACMLHVLCASRHVVPLGKNLCASGQVVALMWEDQFFFVLPSLSYKPLTG